MASVERSAVHAWPPTAAPDVVINNSTHAFGGEICSAINIRFSHRVKHRSLRPSEAEVKIMDDLEQKQRGLVLRILNPKH